MGNDDDQLEELRLDIEAFNRTYSRVAAYDDDPDLARRIEEIAAEAQERLEALQSRMNYQNAGLLRSWQ
ncbi:hypothetical protein [Pseudarthrobacter sp. N5]|uniref:hypothetical protein n=1 Tax=Pseudarthrobacter sp. N5 TaxID=3418416 RepID=UPI003CFA54CD